MHDFKPNHKPAKRTVQTITFFLGLWLLGIAGFITSHSSAHSAQKSLHPAHRALHRLGSIVRSPEAGRSMVSVRRASVHPVVRGVHAAHLCRSCRFRRDNGSGSHIGIAQSEIASATVPLCFYLVRAGLAPRPGPVSHAALRITSPRAPPLV